MTDVGAIEKFEEIYTYTHKGLLCHPTQVFLLLCIISSNDNWHLL